MCTSYTLHKQRPAPAASFACCRFRSNFVGFASVPGACAWRAVVSCTAVFGCCVRQLPSPYSQGPARTHRISHLAGSQRRERRAMSLRCQVAQMQVRRRGRQPAASARQRRDASAAASGGLGKAAQPLETEPRVAHSAPAAAAASSGRKWKCRRPAPWRQASGCAAPTPTPAAV
jgi:hypothetical protein